MSKIFVNYGWSVLMMTVISLIANIIYFIHVLYFIHDIHYESYVGGYVILYAQGITEKLVLIVFSVP